VSDGRTVVGDTVLGDTVLGDTVVGDTVDRQLDDTALLRGPAQAGSSTGGDRRATISSGGHDPALGQAGAVGWVSSGRWSRKVPVERLSSWDSASLTVASA